MTITDDRQAVPTKGPRFRVSAVVLGLGVLIAIPGVIVMGFAIWHALSGPAYRVPGTTELHLGSGEYIVFEHTGDRDTYGPLTIQRGRGVTLSHDQLVVTGPDGQSVTVRNAPPNETIDRNGDRFTSALTFDTPREGDYTLQFDTPEPGQIMVQRSFTAIFTRHVPWIISAAAGWLVALVGMTMLLVGVIRRGRAERATRTALAAGVAGAAWYPDPMGQHRLRYWDGRQWTSYTSD
jgi:hypothetical protein